MARVSVATVVEVLLAALVLFGVGAAATGHLGGLAEAPADDAPDPLPAGPLRPADLAAVRFPLAFRGYRMADVDAVLRRVAGELAGADADIDRPRGEG
jgi:DivIVA domain-containing protein